MEIRKSFCFALFDLKYKKKNTLRTILCFFLLQFIVILWLLISIVLPRTHVNFSKQANAYKYLVSNVYVDDSGNVIEKSEGLALNRFLLDKDYIGIQNPMLCSVDLISYSKQNGRWRFINCDWLTLEVSDSDEELAYAINDSGNLAFNTVACGNQFFYSENEFKRYSVLYKDHFEGAMICGKSELNEKEVIIPDKIMRLFINDEHLWSSMIGKRITIKCKNQILIENYTLKGIYDYRFYKTESYDANDSDINLYLPVYIRCDSHDLINYGIERFQYVFYCKEGVNYIDICNEVFAAGYNNTMPSSEGTFSVYNEIFIAKTEEIIKELVSSMGSVVMVSILLYMAAMIYIEKKNKSGNVGMLKAIGLDTINIILIPSFQQLIISCLAVIPSCCLAYSAIRFINLILDSAVGIGLESTFADFIKSAVIGALFTIIVGIILYIPVIISYVRHEPAELIADI